MRRASAPRVRCVLVCVDNVPERGERLHRLLDSKTMRAFTRLLARRTNEAASRPCTWTNVMGRVRSMPVRGFASSAADNPPAREPKDLHAALASLAAYDSEAAGAFLNKEADKAKGELAAAGYSLVRDFVVHNGKSLSFDGTVEVEEYDVAYLWLREADGRAILAFRGSDTQKNLQNVRSTETCSMYGHHLHAAVAEGEFAPLVAKMSAGDFSSCSTLVVTGHSLGGGCASMLAVLMNDKADPLGFGSTRKTVDELYGFGATAVFHNNEPETPNEYGCHVRGAFRGAIYRTVRTVKGVEVQDRAFNLATKMFHYPKTGLVSLRSSKTPPVAYQSSGVQGAPRWRHKVREMPLDDELFPLHNPVNYVRWLGAQKKRLEVIVRPSEHENGALYGPGESGGLRRSLRLD